MGRIVPGLENSAPHIAHPCDLAGESDSAIAHCTRFMQRNRASHYRLWWLDVAHRAESFEAFGRNYENRQQPDSAAKYYQALLDLWKDADPGLEPQK